jgi:gliding motility-associated-like protein
MKAKFKLFFLLPLSVFMFAKSSVAQVCTFTFSLGNDTAFCPNTPINFNLTAPINAAPYLWDNGTTGATRQVSNFGNYYCTATQLGNNVVTNGNFDLANSGFTSDYIVGTGGTWGPISNPGTYLITTNANIAHSNFQSFNAFGGSGNMMVVNGSGNPNQSVWCQSIVVSPNTDYNFSTWVANCVTPVPLLQFSINGVPLGAVFSPPTATGLWTQFSSTWNSGSNANAVICIVNQNISPPGNDFAIDEISFTPICTFTDTLKVTQKNVPTLVDAGLDTALCLGDSIKLNANQGSGTTFEWTSNPVGFSSFDLTPTIKPFVLTDFVFTAYLDGCAKSDTVSVKVNSLPIPDFSFFTSDSSCNTYSVNLTNKSSNSIEYLWDFDDGEYSTEFSPTHNYKKQGSYDIILVGKNLYCSNSWSRKIDVRFTDGTFFLPNVITPNGDSFNESFYVPTECLESATVSIFNRWGVLVKKWDNLDGFWDGKIKGNLATEGVYYYVMEGAYPNGETTRLQGTISLYR